MVLDCKLDKEVYGALDHHYFIPCFPSPPASNFNYLIIDHVNALLGLRKTQNDSAVKVNTYKHSSMVAIRVWSPSTLVEQAE